MVVAETGSSCGGEGGGPSGFGFRPGLGRGGIFHDLVMGDAPLGAMAEEEEEGSDVALCDVVIVDIEDR
jgi:hypothetical protein